MQRVLAPLLAAPLPGAEAGEHDDAGRDHERGERKAEWLDGRVPAAAASPSCSPAARRRRSARGPSAASTEPTQSRRGARPSRCGLAHQPRAEQDPDRHHDLAGEHHPPAELGRGPAAEDRPDRDPGAGDAAEHAVGDRPVRPLIVARRERDERRAARAPRRCPRGSTSRASGWGRSTRRRSAPSPDRVDARGRSETRACGPRGLRACPRSASGRP